MLSAVSSRYAQRSGGRGDGADSGIDPTQATEQLRQVAAMIATSDDLRGALLTPAVSPSRKRAVMAKLTTPLNIHPKIRNFLYVVIDHRRVHEIPSIAEAFEVLIDEYLGLRSRRCFERESVDGSPAGRAGSAVVADGGEKSETQVYRPIRRWWQGLWRASVRRSTTVVYGDNWKGCGQRSYIKGSGSRT